MADLQAFKEAGIDYSLGLERFLNKEETYNKYLQRFLYDGSFEEFCAGVSMNDMAMAEKALYTLRGTIGNLSMDRLLAAVDEAVAAIHANDDAARVQKAIDEVNLAYQMACDVISSQL